MTSILFQNNTERLAFRLRQCTALPEYQLWEQLCQKAESTTLYQRQVALAGFIVDIFCPTRKLVIEVEGDSHDLKYGDREERNQIFQTMGLKIITISNREIKENIEKLLVRLQQIY